MDPVAKRHMKGELDGMQVVELIHLQKAKGSEGSAEPAELSDFTRKTCCLLIDSNHSDDFKS